MEPKRKIKPFKLILRISEIVKIAFFVMIRFKKPIHILKCYALNIKPKDNRVYLRNGWLINLSSHQDDLVTLIVIFCRNEYGNIAKDVTCVDIGANIGMFTLYALFNGAKKVISIEPNTAAFLVLKKNLEENDLLKKVVLYNKAISSVDDLTIKLPKLSSPYNSSNVILW